MLKPTWQLDSKDIRAMNKTLRNMEGNLLNVMRGEIRKIAKPIITQIKANIPQQAPMSGMNRIVFYKKTGRTAINEGRLRYDGKGTNPTVSKVKKAAPQSITLSQAVKATGRSLTTPLVRIIVNSAAVSMVDMAGRVNKGRPTSREYVIRLRNGELQKRRHRVTTQGQQFVSNLAGRASRYAWPALEDQMDSVERQIEQVIEKYYRIANRGS